MEVCGSCPPPDEDPQGPRHRNSPRGQVLWIGLIQALSRRAQGQLFFDVWATKGAN